MFSGGRYDSFLDDQVRITYTALPNATKFSDCNPRNQLLIYHPLQQ